MNTISLTVYLWAIFGVCTLANLFIAAMFYCRVKRPERAKLWGILSLLMGVPALLLALGGLLGGYSSAYEGGALYWLAPLIYAAFCLLDLFLDYILHIEFRNPRRSAILAPYLVLFYVGLMMMWGMLWNLGVLPWAIAGLSYFAMVWASIYALRNGVG